MTPINYTFPTFEEKDENGRLIKQHVFVLFHFGENRPMLMTKSPYEGLQYSNKELPTRKNFFGRFKKENLVKLFADTEEEKQAVYQNYIKQRNEERAKKAPVGEFVSREQADEWIRQERERRFSSSNWYKLHKEAQIWKTDCDLSYDSEIEKHLCTLYELEYKYNTMKLNGFSGHPKRKMVMLSKLRSAAEPSLEYVKTALTKLYEKWLGAHAITNPEEWAIARVRGNLETGMKMDEAIEIMLGEYFRYTDGNSFYFSQEAKRRMKMESTLLNFLNQLSTSGDPALNNLEEGLKQDRLNDIADQMSYVEEDSEEYQWLEQQQEQVENNEYNLSDYLDGYGTEMVSTMIDEDILISMYENFVFPAWYNKWKAEGIDGTRELVEEAYERIKSIGQGDFSEDLTNINIALHTSHQTGDMIEYMWEYAGEELDKNFLDDLSEIDERLIEEWDQQLREVGVQFGKRPVKISKKWGDDYFPKGRDLVRYMPETNLWGGTDYSETDLAKAIRDPKLRKQFNIPDETWKQLEYRYMRNLPLEYNHMMLNIHEIPEKIKRSPFKR
jgi:hypothetical protein